MKSNSIFKNLTKMLFGNIGSTIVGLISLPLVLHSLSQSEYGIFTLVYALGGIVAAATQLFSGNIILPYVVRAKEKKEISTEKYYVLTYIKSGIILAIVSILAAVIFIFVVYDISGVTLLLLFSFNCIFSLINTYALNIALMYKNYNYIAIVTALRNSVRLVFIFLMLNFFSFTTAKDNMLSYLISELLIFLISFSLYKSIYHRFKNVKSIKTTEIKKIIKDSFYSFSASNIKELQNVFILTIIKKYFGVEAVGLYGAAGKILNSIQMFFKVFETTVFPYINEKLQDAKFIQNISKVTFLVGLVMLGGLNIFIEPIILLLLGDQYLKDILFFRVSFLRIIVYSLQVTQRSLIFSIHKSWFLLTTIGVEFITCVLSIMVLVYLNLGIEYIIISIFFTEMIGYFIRRKLIENYNNKIVN